MPPKILSLGKALPPYSLGQMDLANHLIQMLALDDEEAWMLEKIYRNSCIDKRYSVLPYIMPPHTPDKPAPGMSTRNAIYKKEAPPLAEKSARDALQRWGRSPHEITHVISVSCTGAITPGIEFKLLHALNLKPSVARLGINMMGCFGAFKGLSIAHKICCENPHNRVLLVCTELCSLHFHSMSSLESIVIQSLFADGSSAAILGSELRGDEKPLFEMMNEKSYALSDTEQEMTWDASDFGFDMTLSAKVPGLIEQNLKHFVADLVGADKSLQLIEWPVHPGGKAILEAIEKSLSLDRSQTRSSWNILAKYGNLSSATFLMVLDDLITQGTSKQWSVGLGFGPGLSIEGVLLRNAF